MRILQLIDSLATGGAERMAINYANELLKYPQIEISCLCATRAEGNLKLEINKEVDYFFLKRKSIFDIMAFFRLRNFILRNRIDIVQAHGTSFFLGTLVRISLPELKLIWHNHYGNSINLNRGKFSVLKWASRYFTCIFSVNKNLVDWAKIHLHHDKVHFLRNFVVPVYKENLDFNIAGNTEARIVCTANLRPEKGHVLLLKAFADVTKKIPRATLHLFGKNFNDIYSQKLLQMIRHHQFASNIFYYGEVMGLPYILPRFDIGVLASSSEGLPLALLEYGMAGLPVVATKVGEVEEVIKDNGICIETDDAESLTKGILAYLNDSNYARNMGTSLNKNISSIFSVSQIMPSIIKIYESIIR